MSHKPHDPDIPADIDPVYEAAQADRGPALDQEPIIVTDRDIGDEGDLDTIDTSQIRVTLPDLSFRQFAALSHTLGAGLLAFHPKVWMADADDVLTRLALMDQLMQLADRAMTQLTDDEAFDLKKKLARATTDIYTTLGIDIEEVRKKVIAKLSSIGVPAEADVRAAPVDS